MSYNSSSNFFSHTLLKHDIQRLDNDFLIGLRKLIINTRDPSVSQRVVYTSIYGNIDNLKEVESKDSAISYQCFTDNENLKSDSWNVIHSEDFFGSPRLTAKAFKLFPHLIFPNSQESLWVDGSYKIKKPLSQFFDECTNDKSIVFYRHPLRDCPYKEAKVCILLGLDETGVIANQIRNYKELGMPEKNGLIHGAVIYRKHDNQDMCELMEDWWLEINKHSIRDQLSLNFIAWSKGIKINYVPEATLADNEYFEWQGHQNQTRKHFLRKVYQRVLISWINAIG